MLFDAHNHIQNYEFAGNLSEVLERASQAGVNRMMACATGAKGDWDRLLHIDDDHCGVVSISIGLHPWYVGSTVLDWKGAMQRILEERPFCIGEIGLDRSDKNDSPIEDQVKAFAWQLDLALERNLPVTIHCVNAWEHLNNALLTRPKLRYMLHGYHASPEITAALAKRNAYFSISPMSLGTHVKPIGPTLVRIPQERLLIETDSPDAKLPKDMNPSTPNEPARVRDVCTHLAKLIGKAAEEVEKQTFENAERFYSLTKENSKTLAQKA